MTPVLLVGTMMWAWKVCEQIAEWRYTVRWVDSLKGWGTRPTDDFQMNLRSGLFALETVAILGSLFWAWAVLTLLDRLGFHTPRLLF